MAQKKKTISLIKKQRRMGYFFIFPLILGIFFVFVPNLLMTLQFSFNEIQINGSEGYTLIPQGFRFYKEALTVDAVFIPSIFESYKEIFINMPVILIFSMLIASMLNQKFKGRSVSRIIFFIPIILSTGILLEIEGNITDAINSSGLQTGGAVDGVLTFNLSDVLSRMNFNKTLIEIIQSAVTNIYKILQSSGMQIFIFLAGLQEIPVHLYEAAKIEGCSEWEVFWKITFPMLAPQTTVNLVYTLVLVGQGGKALTYSGFIGDIQGNYGLSTAMCMLYILSMAIVLSVLFKVLSKIGIISASETI